MRPLNQRPLPSGHRAHNAGNARDRTGAVPGCWRHPLPLQADWTIGHVPGIDRFIFALILNFFEFFSQKNLKNF